jgi:hypothetical protein
MIGVRAVCPPDGKSAAPDTRVLPRHERRRPEPAPAWVRLELARRVVADERWRQLTPGQRLVVHVGITQYLEGRGRLWPSVPTLARKVGVSERLVQEAIGAAVVVGLITSAVYFRPNGRQGSNTLTVDPAVMEGGADRRPLWANAEGRTDRYPFGAVRGERIDRAEGVNEASAHKGGTDRTPYERRNVGNGRGIDQETPICPTCDGDLRVKVAETERGADITDWCPDCSRAAA